MMLPLLLLLLLLIISIILIIITNIDDTNTTHNNNVNNNDIIIISIIIVIIVIIIIWEAEEKIEVLKADIEKNAANVDPTLILTCVHTVIQQCYTFICISLYIYVYK